MLDPKLRQDIRIIKFQDYIRRKPNRPFGYFGLGVQHLLSGKIHMADRMFNNALKLDPGYGPARLGKLEIYLTQNRFAAAAGYYDKNRDLFQSKKIYIHRVNRLISRFYNPKQLGRHGSGLYFWLFLNENISVLKRRTEHQTYSNPVVNIVLSMIWLKYGRTDEKARLLYRRCVELDEINDKLRWDLLKVLSEKQPELLQNDKIAGLFSTIPENAFGTEYADFLLVNFIKTGNESKVLKAFESLRSKHIIPDKKTLWHYLNFCRERNIWNESLSFCCQSLINAGWTDNLLFSSVKELDSRGLWKNTRETSKFLMLYGYS